MFWKKKQPATKYISAATHNGLNTVDLDLDFQDDTQLYALCITLQQAEVLERMMAEYAEVHKNG